MAEIKLEDVTKIYRPGIASKLLKSQQTPPETSQATGTELSKSDEIRALDELNLVVPDGKTVAIVGPSGCGKSTLLRVVAGLTEYTGLVAYDGRDMQEVSPGERRIGMVFQNYALYPHFYGQGNLNFFFRVNRAPDEEAAERIRITSEMMGFGFKQLLKRKPGTLSGGQQQRLAIARALVREPELFLFDEPLSNLDAKLRARTRTEIKRLLHTFGITAIYVTHDQTEAMALGDLIAVMRAGRVEQVGTFNDILQNPTNAFVAGFLGLPPMNLLEGTVTDRSLVVNAENRLPLPSSIATQVHTGQRIILGIRPEAARIQTEGVVPEASLCFVGTIDVVEPDFGRSQQVAFVSTDAFSCRVIAPIEERLIRGYEAWVCFPESSLYFFDAESEQRIKLAKNGS